MQETIHTTAAHTVGRAGAQPCVKPANTDAQFQVLAKSAADVRAGCGVAPSAEAGTEVKEAAAVAGPAVVLPGAIDEASAGQDDSQGQPGGLRLDLSSEEDPLLCTQRMPPSQGESLCCAAAVGSFCCLNVDFPLFLQASCSHNQHIQSSQMPTS